jgi:hypothetical protein
MVEMPWRSAARLLRMQGARPAIFSLVVAFVIAVLDSATTAVIPALGTWLRDTLWPPAFTVELTTSTKITGISLSSLEDEAEHEIKFSQRADKYLTINAATGNYYMTLRQQTEGVERKLITKADLLVGGQTVTVKTEPSNWASDQELKNIGDTAATPGGVLKYTRWTSTRDDELLLLGATGVTGRILKTAFGELGVHENGSTADTERIAEYWKAVPTWPVSQTTAGVPWGGTFLSWAVEEAGIASPKSASFLAWQKWGKVVQRDEAVPGMIGIVPQSELVQAPSRLLVGIILRRLPECTEIVTGNVADRVVVTCVKDDKMIVRAPA